jgi:hypothetical protein
MKRVPALLVLLSCSSPSTTSTDAPATSPPPPASCADAFRDACTRAQACWTDGRARVGYAGDAVWVDYESGAYCASRLPDSKCGASALQPPLDASRCVSDLPTASCATLDDGRRGLELPASCR